MELTQANKEHHAPLLAAVGLLTPTMTSFQMWWLAHAVAEDALVTERRFDEQWQETDTLEVVEEMTDTERKELADRIRTKHPNWF